MCYSMGHIENDMHKITGSSTEARKIFQYITVNEAGEFLSIF